MKNIRKFLTFTIIIAILTATCVSPVLAGELNDPAPANAGPDRIAGVLWIRDVIASSGGTGSRRFAFLARDIGIAPSSNIGEVTFRFYPQALGGGAVKSVTVTNVTSEGYDSSGNKLYRARKEIEIDDYFRGYSGPFAVRCMVKSSAGDTEYSSAVVFNVPA